MQTVRLRCASTHGFGIPWLTSALWVRRLQSERPGKSGALTGPAFWEKAAALPKPLRFQGRCASKAAYASKAA